MHGKQVMLLGLSIKIDIVILNQLVNIIILLLIKDETMLITLPNHLLKLRSISPGFV